MIEAIETETIQEYAVRAKQIAVYDEGERREWAPESNGGAKLLSAWKKMTENSVQMPAFGVSIDSLTKEEKKKGLWIEFLFEGEQMVGGMPFSRLLVGIRPEYRGFNVIRFWENGYNGRCFYVDLRNEDMTEFFKEVHSVFADYRDAVK